MAMVPSDFSYHGVVDNGPNGFTQGRREKASKLGPSWYFSRKELEKKSPSRRDGIDWKKESNLRKSYCTFLQDLGKKLKLPQLTIATAMVFCHRFYLCQSLAKNDRRIIATVCMFLAGKVEETPIALKDVILISYEFIHKKDPTAGQRIKQQKELFDKQKELILLGEQVVLVTLEFDLNIHHAYKPLVEAIRRFNVGDINNFPQVAWSFVNDGMSSTSLCLQFEPHQIAAGVIFLAAKFLKVKLPSFWYQEFDVTLQQLEDFSNQMLELYQPNHTTQAQPSHGGEAKGSSAGVRNQHSSVLSDENSKEPSAHGRHQVSRLSNLQHSSSTGAPGHHVIGHSNSDKHFSDHKILQNDNGGSRVKNMSGTKSDACMDRLHHDKKSSPGHHYSKASYESHNLAEEHKPHRSHDNSNGTREAPGMSTLRADGVQKIDKDKVKAALENQSKSKVGVSRKINVMDDGDYLIEENMVLNWLLRMRRLSRIRGRTCPKVACLQLIFKSLTKHWRMATISSRVYQQLLKTWAFRTVKNILHHFISKMMFLSTRHSSLITCRSTKMARMYEDLSRMKKTTKGQSLNDHMILDGTDGSW